jgi:V/A-type H+-transporting ATPase subunit C
MSSIATYGFINAKIRAMRSFILADSVFRSMAAAGSLQDVITILAQTRFKNVAEKMRHKDPSEIELLLLGEEIDQLQTIRKNSKGVVLTLIMLLLETYDISKLKVILRRWHHPKGLEPEIFREKILYDFPMDAMFAAESYDAFVDFLASTPYQTVLSAVKNEYETSHSVFPVELALDRDWVKRLWEFTELLNKKDREITRKLLGLEIDLKNLNWIERFRIYYAMPSAEIANRILPFGFHLRETELRKILSEGNILAGTGKMLGTKDMTIPKKDGQSSNLETLEYFLYNLLFQEAHRAFHGFPFSIGSLLGYYFLHHIEIKNIQTLLHTKWYGLPAEKAEALLIL